MRTPVLVALTMVTAFGATVADAQSNGARLGHAGGTMPGASFPMPGAQMPRPPMQGMPMQGMPMQGPRPPMMQQPGRPYPGNYPQQPGLQHPYPGQPNPGHGYPGQTYPNQPYPNRPNPGTYPGGGQYWGGGSRWGGSIGGHWAGGVNAPGGWRAYRRPSRGYRLSTYWNSPNFYIDDYASYGLSTPPQGYGWRRYYDDAVLTDRYGRVYDSAYDLDWDNYGGQAYDEGYASQGGYADSGYAYAPGYQTLPPVSQSGNVTTYSTGGYYPGGSTTVVTIMGAPATTTTTTTEYVEETRTRYVAPRVVYRKKVWRKPVRRSCGCVRRAVEQPILGS